MFVDLFAQIGADRLFLAQFDEVDNGEKSRNPSIGVNCRSMISDHTTMMRTLISLIPDSMKVLVIMAVGLCLIVGLISLRKAMRWLGYIVLLLLAAPFYGIILKMLPGWLVVVLILIAIWRTFRVVAEALLGREGASH